MGDDLFTDKGQLLLELARSSIGEKLGVETKTRNPKEYTEFLETKQGLFVTLHKKGALRGCIGTIEPSKTLGEGIAENACHAAFHDHRFSPLTVEEYHEVDIEISLLSIPEKLEFSNAQELMEKLKPSVHGVILEKGSARATFLPQVWEQLPRCEDFLGRLCEKAGLESTAWRKKGVTVHTYEVRSFAEKNHDLGL